MKEKWKSVSDPWAALRNKMKPKEDPRGPPQVLFMFPIMKMTYDASDASMLICPVLSSSWSCALFLSLSLESLSSPLPGDYRWKVAFCHQVLIHTPPPHIYQVMRRLVVSFVVNHVTFFQRQHRFHLVTWCCTHAGPEAAGRPLQKSWSDGWEKNPQKNPTHRFSVKD